MKGRFGGKSFLQKVFSPLERGMDSKRANQIESSRLFVDFCEEVQSVNKSIEQKLEKISVLFGKPKEECVDLCIELVWNDFQRNIDHLLASVQKAKMDKLNRDCELILTKPYDQMNEEEKKLWSIAMNNAQKAILDNDKESCSKPENKLSEEDFDKLAGLEG